MLNERLKILSFFVTFDIVGLHKKRADIRTSLHGWEYSLLHHFAFMKTISEQKYNLISELEKNISCILILLIIFW